MHQLYKFTGQLQRLTSSNYNENCDFTRYVSQKKKALAVVHYQRILLKL